MEATTILTRGEPGPGVLPSSPARTLIWRRKTPVSALPHVIAESLNNAIIVAVNGTHRKTLEKVLSDPVNGNIEWARIESLLKAAGCRVVEGAGSSVTFEFNGRKMTLHRPHPGKEALRYRVLAVREFVERMGIKP